MRSDAFYETEAALSQYLFFHYGDEGDLMPYLFEPRNSLHFPVRCVTECLETKTLPHNARALDLGCAVGRTSFELTRHCANVVAIDYSSAFIAAAEEIQQSGRFEYSIVEEGAQRALRTARLPDGVFANRVQFVCADVMEFATVHESYEVVLAANLLCRVSNPLAFLRILPKLVSPQGQLILISPYSWLEEYTPRALWLKTALDSLQEALGEYFDLQRFFDMPFLIREHYRKFQWGVAQATIWKRKI
jgi:putative 4-mercaptohistidine N1-methyltranferase